MKLFAGLSLVLSTLITWVLMLTHQPAASLSTTPLFSFRTLKSPLSPVQIQMLEALRAEDMQVEALMFTGTQQHVLLNVSSLGKFSWLQEETPAQRNALAAQRIRPLMQQVWQAAQWQLAQDGININQIKTLGLWYARDSGRVEISNALSQWGL
ncbi:hypothetical protein [Deinococcus roseus]|uniref:Uncharacterized protein n=1 Tax=Deinococcus roseus TaxID=392414 RepID=A0ABQ2D6B5_9DEIO|nr:hypothetical protein [Deinococcus roseus]GGJ44869.1 hypothetical protein GCM10008938_33880 [Deinococcus roseus]